jgi:hypothetical protein
VSRSLLILIARSGARSYLCRESGGPGAGNSPSEHLLHLLTQSQELHQGVFRSRAGSPLLLAANQR